MGHTSDFTQETGSIQIEHETVDEAKTGDEIGLKVVDHAREHDKVFKITG
jgi:translation elongation factor EF-1alpha